MRILIILIKRGFNFPQLTADKLSEARANTPLQAAEKFNLRGKIHLVS